MIVTSGHIFWLHFNSQRTSIASSGGESKEDDVEGTEWQPWKVSIGQFTLREPTRLFWFLNKSKGSPGVYRSGLAIKLPESDDHKMHN
jgi:hypothetical protein